MIRRKPRTISLSDDIEKMLQEYLDRTGQKRSHVVCAALRKHIQPKLRKVTKREGVKDAKPATVNA